MTRRFLMRQSLPFIALLLVTISPAHAATPTTRPAINPTDASAVFEMAKTLSDRDGGRLWGRPLYGPMLLVDPATRFVAANQPDTTGILAPVDAQPGVFVGTLPENLGVANTATDWAGARWTMVMLPINDNPAPRGRLLMHELYHRIQPDIGLPAANPSNNHLDTRDGRVFLRLEWRALAAALLAEPGDDRARAVRDALAFRRHRQSLFPAARDAECALEMNEGLAEYTGYRLCGLPDWAVRDRVVLRLAEQEQQPGYVRNFAYASGPAYGLLLDDAKPEWRRALKPSSDLATILADAMNLPRPPHEDSASLAEAARRYRGEQLTKAEDERAAKHNQDLADARRRFIESPVLIVPLSRDVQYTYDPNGIVAIDEDRSVYHTCQIIDAFGRLNVDGDAMIVRKDGHLAEVRLAKPAKTGDEMRGDGWSMKLNEGWRIIPGQRPGDVTIGHEP
jgi:hypothetical protein